MSRKNEWAWMCRYRLYTHASKTKNMNPEDRDKYFQKSIKNYRIIHEHSPEQYILQCLYYRKKVLENYPSSQWEKQKWDCLMKYADDNLHRILNKFSYTYKYCAWFERMLFKLDLSNNYLNIRKLSNVNSEI